MYQYCPWLFFRHEKNNLKLLIFSDNKKYVFGLQILHKSMTFPHKGFIIMVPGLEVKAHEDKNGAIPCQPWRAVCRRVSPRWCS